MQVKTLLLAICWIAFSIPSFARGKIASPLVKNHALKFVRNDGQIVNQTGQLRPELHTRLKTSNNLNVFTGVGSLIYQWRGKEGMYRVEANLIGANTNIQPLYEVPLSYTEQNFGKGKNIKASSYARIVYPAVYPNIDWVLYVNDGGYLKYDFIVHPGGNPLDIRIRYSGATAISLQKDGSLSVESPMGVLGEHAPICFTREGKAVGSRFVLADNTVSFDVDSYSGTLVIDPELSWGTYYGGLGKEHNDDIAVDAYGNTYITGYTFSSDNIATTGAFATTYSGSDITNNAGDAFIAKFDCSGNQLWATYYGGEAAERGWNVEVDDFGNVYMAGFTNLLSGLPSSDNLATSGSHQSIPAGGDGELFLAKFDSTGNRIWATYYGGSLRECSAVLPAGLALDKEGHVYLSGTTNSTTGISTTGAYQTSVAGGNDAFLVQFDTAGVRQWATYFGGTGNDRAGSIYCDESANVYLTGITNSSTGISSTGSHQATFGGGNDAYLAKFNVDGERQWSTYYGGTGNADEGLGLYTDTAKNIYLAGRTNSTSAISTTTAHQATYGGGLYDAFLVKFDSAGSRQWATYFGGINQGGSIGYNNLSGNSNGAIYLCGFARETDSMATIGSYIDLHAGLDDAFLAKFNTEGALDWSTYFGGGGSELATAVKCDPYGYLYLTGVTSSTSGIATSGSYQDVFGGGTHDGFILKFADSVLFPMPDTVYGPNLVCTGMSATYHVPTVPGAIAYSWTLPSGWSGSSTTDSIEITVGLTSDTIKITALFSCGESNMVLLPVNVLTAPELLHTSANLCATDTVILALNATSGITTQWQKNGIDISGAIDTFLQVTDPGIYRVYRTSLFCSDTSNALEVYANPTPVITQSGNILSTTTAFTSYQWNYEGSAISGAISPSLTVVLNGGYSVTVTDSNGCVATSDTVLYQPTNLNELSAGADIKVYPNPTRDLLVIDAKRPLNVQLLSVDGRMVLNASAVNEISLGDLPSGLYALKIYDKDNQYLTTRKIVIQQRN